MKLYPLKFQAIYKEKIWGGDRLSKLYKRELPNKSIGESWEIAAHSNGTSIVENGIYQGKSITELIDKYQEKLLGKKIKFIKNKPFPLLIKILDANAKLSVQVHPDNDYAARVENELGKTEMWYILEAHPEAKLIYGLKSGTKKEEFAKAIKNGCPEKYLNEVEVEKGDIFYMPSGTIHAIKEGILLAEIQQNSDTTYRVHDWNRLGKDGSPRQLHINRALDVINFQEKSLKAKSIPLIIDYKDYTRSILAACPYFVTEKIQVKNDYQLNLNSDRFYIIMNLQGEGTLTVTEKDYKINSGDTYFLPAKLKNINIKGQLEFLLTYLPDSRDSIISEMEKLGFSKREVNNLAGINDWE